MASLPSQKFSITKPNIMWTDVLEESTNRAIQHIQYLKQVVSTKIQFSIGYSKFMSDLTKVVRRILNFYYQMMNENIIEGMDIEKFATTSKSPCGKIRFIQTMGTDGSTFKVWISFDGLCETVNKPFRFNAEKNNVHKLLKSIDSRLFGYWGEYRGDFSFDPKYVDKMGKATEILHFYYLPIFDKNNKAYYLR